MTEPRTHSEISRRLCGEPQHLAEGEASVVLVTTEEMRVDDRGLVHGGFVFGVADHAAMLAVNDPNVVLTGAEVRFVAPVRIGETVQATARVASADGRRRDVRVTVERDGEAVMRGSFTCLVLEQHVLEARR